ncbi:MAG: hypothetical protein KKG33_13050 [candidate division Zixibacteria bacterium]|nr:hypothetical protein [candidate division Zixibacteria bacterium]
MAHLILLVTTFDQAPDLLNLVHQVRPLITLWMPASCDLAKLLRLFYVLAFLHLTSPSATTMLHIAAPIKRIPAKMLLFLSCSLFVIREHV